MFRRYQPCAPLYVTEMSGTKSNGPPFFPWTQPPYHAGPVLRGSGSSPTLYTASVPALNAITWRTIWLRVRIPGTGSLLKLDFIFPLESVVIFPGRKMIQECYLLAIHVRWFTYSAGITSLAWINLLNSHVVSLLGRLVRGEGPFLRGCKHGWKSAGGEVSLLCKFCTCCWTTRPGCSTLTRFVPVGLGLGHSAVGSIGQRSLFRLG